MINDFKYLFPFKLRSTEDFISPKGPSFKQALSKTCKIGGCEVSLKVPKWSQDEILGQKGLSNEDLLHSPLNESYCPGWKSSRLMFVVWRFIGPWFTGKVAEVNTTITLHSPSKQSSTTSYFHPSAFETAVAKMTAENLCPQKSAAGNYKFSAPLNWQVLSLPIPATYFETLPVNGIGYRYEECWLAVGDQLLLQISFRIHQSCSGSNEEADQKIDREPMKNLVLQVIDSLKVSLSTELQTKVDSIREANPELKVSETCAPLDLSSYEADLAKAIEEDEKAKQEEREKAAHQPDNIAAEIIRRVQENPELFKSGE